MKVSCALWSTRVQAERERGARSVRDGGRRVTVHVHGAESTSSRYAGTARVGITALRFRRSFVPAEPLVLGDMRWVRARQPESKGGLPGLGKLVVMRAVLAGEV